MRFSISRKILVSFLLVVIFSLVVTNLFWYFSFRQNLEGEIFERQKKLAEETVEHLGHLLGEKLRLLIVYSELSDVLIFSQFGEKKEDVLTQLHRLLLQDKDLAEISILNRKGKEVVKIDARQEPFYEVPEEELLDRSKTAEFLAPTYRIPKEYQSELYFSDEGKPKITLAVPLTFPKTPREFERLTKTEPRFITTVGIKPEEVLGVLTVEVNLERIFQEMIEKEVGREGYLYLVDHSHKIFAHPDKNLAKERLDVSRLLVIKEVPHPDQPLIITGRGKNEKEIVSLMTHAHFPELGWIGIVIQEPIAQAFLPIFEIQRLTIFFAFLGIIFAGLVSLFNANRLVKPIQKLHLAAEGVERGDFSLRADVKTKDEIEDLANAFNKMLDQIQASQTALGEAKTALEIKVEARTKELKDLAEGLEEEVNRRTKEIQEKMAELERFQKLAVGRELKMVELKKEIEKLKKELEKYGSKERKKT